MLTDRVMNFEITTTITIMIVIIVLFLLLGSVQFLLHGPPWKYSSKN